MRKLAALTASAVFVAMAWSGLAEPAQADIKVEVIIMVYSGTNPAGTASTESFTSPPWFDTRM